MKNKDSVSYRERIRMRFKVASGVMDFLGVVGCTVLIIGMLALLVNLYSWFADDLIHTFAGLQKNMSDAVLIEDRGK